jgi:hypothetical protein
VTAGGPGSRARSRELGYAEAMREIGWLLRDEAEKWQGTADLQLSREFEAAMTVCAREMDRIGRLALDTSLLHCERGDFAGNISHLAYLEREWGHEPAPRELPGHDRTGRTGKESRD